MSLCAAKGSFVPGKPTADCSTADGAVASRITTATQAQASLFKLSGSCRKCFDRHNKEKEHLLKVKPSAIITDVLALYMSLCAPGMQWPVSGH